MNWLNRMLISSLGKKMLMALTGLAFVGFLAAHLAGNLSVYAGPETFNNYAAHLQDLGVLLFAAEVALAFLAVIHVTTGLTLFYQNTKARPVRYMVNKNAGGRTIGSMTMPYTGILLLIFIFIHLANFTWADKSDTKLFKLVSSTFHNPLYVAFYIFIMLVAALHVSHGFWSAFQTLGANHPKYMPAIRTLGVIFALIVAIGFGMLPIYFSLSA